VHFNVLKLGQAVDVPVAVNSFVLSLCVLDKVTVHANLGSVAFGDQNYLTELAQNVAVIRETYCFVIIVLFVERERLMFLADYNRRLTDCTPRFSSFSLVGIVTLYTVGFRVQSFGFLNFDQGRHLFKN